MITLNRPDLTLQMSNRAPLDLEKKRVSKRPEGQFTGFLALNVDGTKIDFFQSRLNFSIFISLSVKTVQLKLSRLTVKISLICRFIV